MAEEQVTVDREEIANEVWGNAEPSPEPVEVAPQETEVAAEAVVEPEDPWAGVPAALRAEVETLRAKVGTLDEMGYRLKQAESRLGGVLNELHTAKEVAKTVAQAPTKEQIETAAKSESDWADLKENFPEWTTGIEAKLAAERADILRHVPNVEAIRQEIQSANGAELANLKIDFAKTIVSVKHPNWEQTRDSPEFMAWNEKTGNRNSFDPLVVISILDEFSEYKAKQKSPEAIAKERKARLELAQTTPGHRLQPAKSEADMTESELRAAVAKQVWG